MGKLRLPPEKVTELKQRQRELHDILPDISALEQCGADCTIPMQQYEMAQERIAALLKNFGPDSTNEERR